MPIKRAKAVIRKHFKKTEIEPKMSHRLLGVVVLKDGVYHFWSKKPLHEFGNNYTDEFPKLLKKAFGFEGLHDDRCENHIDKKNAFQFKNEDWNPRVVDWAYCLRFKDGLDEKFNFQECEIFLAEESPFKDKIK